MQLRVTVERVAFPAATVADAKWFILMTDKGPCKGKMGWRPGEKEQLILEGSWAVYQGNREFKFDSATIDVPTNEREKLHYVCERTKGIGPAMERHIWEVMGKDWANVEGCASVPGMTSKIRAEYRVQIEGLKSNSAQAEAIAWLMGKGATMNMASWAWVQWGAGMVGVITSDPYRLCELANYGFGDVDREIRGNFGIGDDDPRRIQAGVIYALRKLTDGGDTLVTWDALYKRACGLLAGHSELITEAATKLMELGEICGVESVSGMALKADFWAEKGIAEFVGRGAA